MPNPDRGAPTRRQALLLPITIAAANGQTARPRMRIQEVRRLAAPEANQAVAVDDGSVYAIGNHTVARYDKRSGRRLSGWECEKGKPLIHLNSGIVRGGVLYCAHSNYPGGPMVSSIETWDSASLTHSGSHSFGIAEGSATWVDFRGPRRYVTFAHYGDAARSTTLVEFDSEWRRLQAWVYPEDVISRLAGYSISGGAFGPDGTIYCTGHDAPEVYVLRFPKGGSTLVLEQIVPSANPGQGIALDPADPAALYGIDRRARQIVEMRVRRDG